MKVMTLKNIKKAKKYAKALFENAKETSKAQIALENLFFIENTINSNEELTKFLYNPVITKEDKKDVLNKIFSSNIDNLVLNLCFVLVDNNALNILNDIYQLYAELYDESKNIIKPNIVSAVELNEEQKQKIVNKLSLKLNKTVVPTYEVDNSIIAGIIVEIGDKIIDLSLKEKFNKLQQQLAKGKIYGSD